MPKLKSKVKTWACFAVIDDVLHSYNIEAADEGLARARFVENIAAKLKDTSAFNYQDYGVDWVHEIPYQGVFIVESAQGSTINWT